MSQSYLLMSFDREERDQLGKRDPTIKIKEVCDECDRFCHARTGLVSHARTTKDYVMVIFKDD